MRRERLGTGSLALVLLAASAATAIPFRHEALLRLAPSGVSWDAALHALSGLDLFDDLRLLRPLDALGDVLSQRWWGPLFGFVLAPCYTVFGRSLAAATLPSFIAYLLAAPAALLAARGVLGRLPAFESVALAAIVGAFVLRAPMLLEMSAWIMLESLGGLLAVMALGLFSFRSALARRTAFALAAALFFLKYHFGFFALASLGVSAWLAQDQESRRRWRESLRGLVPRRGAAALGAFALGALALTLVATRLALESRGSDALARRLPSASNVLWAVFVVAIVFLAARRRLFLEAWRGAPAMLRDFALFGLLPPFVWCLDPAHVRAWFRQTFQATDVPVRNPLEQAASYVEFLRADYALAVLPFGLALAGLGFALVLPGGPARRTLAAFAFWPVLLMSLNPYPAEARFVGCLVPALFAAAAAGLVTLAARLPRLAGRALLLAVVAALSTSFAVNDGKWRREAEARATYRYPYDDAGRRAVTAALTNAALADASGTGPVRVVIPAEPPVWPTVRLVVRLARREVAPADLEVVVVAGP